MEKRSKKVALFARNNPFHPIIDPKRVQFIHERVAERHERVQFNQERVVESCERVASGMVPVIRYFKNLICKFRLINH